MASFEAGNQVATLKGTLMKRRPNNIMGSLSAKSGWKTRHCMLQANCFSWAEDESSAMLGTVDMTGAKVDGKAMHAGGSDIEADQKLRVFKVVPLAEHGKPIELQAATVNDAREWIKALQNSSNGIIPSIPPAEPPASSSSSPGSSSVTTATGEASAPAPAAVTATDTAAINADSTGGTWKKLVTDDGNTYYYNETTGETSWDLPPNCTAE